MKYRIRMNANGRFIIERKAWRLGLWHQLGKWENDDQPSFSSGSSGYQPTLVFDTSELACEALLKAQEADRKEEREKQWTTVIEETK